jgi:HEAT repeat protein
MKTFSKFGLLVPFACAVAFGALAVQTGAAAAENEKDLIAILNSDKPGGDKAIACKKLAIYGSEAAVPTLAPLLCDPHLASWARIALEAIPGAAADEALRQAIPKVQGRLLVGTINSIGVRKDAKALPLLEQKLKDQDGAVVAAAADAMGRIGGSKAARGLRSALAKAPESLRGGIAEGCVRCAEQFLAEGKNSAATRLYDAVRKAAVPKQELLDATRGAILARKDKGIPLLLEQLRSQDKQFVAIGLSTARELPGAETTKALVAELHAAAADRQPMLLLALSDRKDAGVMPAVIDAAGSNSKPLRLTAIRVLDNIGKESGVDALEKAAASDDADISQAAIGALSRLQGSALDRRLAGDLDKAQGKTRCALIEVAGRRGMETALPAILRSARNQDAGVRTAAYQAIGVMGGSGEMPELIRLLRSAPAQKDRTALEEALLSICSRGGSGCVPNIEKLVQDQDGTIRLTALHLLAASGGPEALNALKTAASDKDEAVADEAVRTLSSWPNTWPEDETVAEPLLTVAKSSSKPSHQVLALRGYLQFLEGDKKLEADAKVTRLGDVVPLLQRPEEKRLAIAVLRGMHSHDALMLLAQFAEDQSVSDDAFSAGLDIATRRNSGLDKEQRIQVLEYISEHTSNPDIKQHSDAALKKLK